MERATQMCGESRPPQADARTVSPDDRALVDGRQRPALEGETITVAAIENSVDVLVEAREILAEFQAIIRRKALADLDAWIDRANHSLVAAFARGIIKDKDAVEAAIALLWSNGQTEGQICKLKLVKRQMYGRGKLDLLQARVIGFTWTALTKCAYEPRLDENLGSRFDDH